MSNNFSCTFIEIINGHTVSDDTEIRIINGMESVKKHIFLLCYAVDARGLPNCNVTGENFPSWQ